MTAFYGPAFLSGSSVGPLELLLILAVVLILFGPERLPEVARNLGRMLAQFRRASDDLKGQIMRLDQDVDRPNSPNVGSIKPPVVTPAQHSAPRLPAPLADATATEPAPPPSEAASKPDTGEPV